jgi:hypothetical protein
MRNRTVKYTDKSLGKVKIVADFLPRPDELALKEETVKVTLSLTKSSVDYFKSVAKKKHTRYQKMIRALLDSYSEHYQ